MSTDSKKTGNNIFRVVVSKTQLPCDLLEGEFRLEMRGRRELYIFGGKRILKYSDSEMVIRAKVFDVIICGDKLTCASFHQSGIVIKGLVKSIELENFE